MKLWSLHPLSGYICISNGGLGTRGLLSARWHGGKPGVAQLLMQRGGKCGKRWHGNGHREEAKNGEYNLHDSLLHVAGL